MKCANCGKELTEETRYCWVCEKMQSFRLKRTGIGGTSY